MIKLNYKIPSYVGSFKTFSAVFFIPIFYFIFTYTARYIMLILIS